MPPKAHLRLGGPTRTVTASFAGFRRFPWPIRTGIAAAPVKHDGARHGGIQPARANIQFKIDRCETKI
ncbi:MAG: hypothetical protein LBT74_08130 [Acidobacteriota bacterium]|jgi:hypothetical protein|nr:hypothetical protein [Acidobacteriota bacterium]